MAASNVVFTLVSSFHSLISRSSDINYVRHVGYERRAPFDIDDACDKLAKPPVWLDRPDSRRPRQCVNVVRVGATVVVVVIAVVAAFAAGVRTEPEPVKTVVLLGVVARFRRQDGKGW